MGVGRKRKFDKEVALTRAMELFWRNGFNGTSLSQLTQAMGINKPSMYAAFGNKEEVFISALKLYVQKHGVPHFDKLLEDNVSLPQRIQNYLASIAEMLADKELPGGCLVTFSTCEAGGDSLPSKAVENVTQTNLQSIEVYRDFFRAEQQKGNLAPTASPEVLADLLLTLQFGLAVMAKNGVERKRLIKIIGQDIAGI